MSDLVSEIRGSIERDERVRNALLGVVALVLAIAFMLLLISDQVQAAV